MDDRRKWIILAILCVALTIVVIGLSSGLAAKSTLPPPSEPEEIVDPQPSQESLSSTTVAPDVLTTPENTKPWQLTRLPVQVQPYHYDVHLIPDLESGKFTGTVDIGLRVLNPTSYVIVNLAFLNVTSVVLSSFEQSQDIQVHFAYAQNEVYVVESSWLLPEDNYTLHMEFEGSLVGSLVGFYRSSYMDTVKNVTRYLAASKFEPTYARRAFPCFDEPDLKATFQITLTHSPDMTALSNMNVKSSRESNGVTETIFNTSVPMSTYLVTFVVCDFNFTENKTIKGKPFRVFSRPDQINSTKYALNAGIKVQDYYEEYFGIPYPLPKQDMIAVPDFVSGAMEHWGLITYRETLLFYEEKKVSASQKRSIANVIAHELTHQWFGNLVTMKWWDDLWLNEGFASYFAYEGMAQLDTDWKNWRKSADFLLETLHESLRLDSSLSSHPIIQPVNHPDEITSIFDLISYRKGASVIRMLEAFITEEAFKRALHKYLTLFAYRNAETKDLWNLMTQENTGINVTKVMNTWTHQMGYPVVFVKREGNKFIVNQTRFLEDNSLTVNISESPYRYLWEIPLTYKLGSGGEVKTKWMNLDQQITWEEQDLSNVEFIKFNIDQTGVYRVNYEKAIWDQLIEAMCQNTSKKSSSGLSEADFTNLLDDSFALFYNGMLSQNIFFELCKCLQNQRHYSMWIIAANGFRSLSNLLKDTSAITVLRNFAIKLVTPMYDDVGWEDEGTYQDRVLRNVILEFACDFDHVSCLEVASKKFGDWLNDSNSVPIDLQDVVLMNGLSASGANSTVLWETIWSRYLVEPSPQTKSDLLSCLATTQTPWLLSRLLESTFNEKEIRSQDAINVISDVSSNPTGMYIAWHFYRANWKRLVEKFQLNDRNLGNLVKSLTSRFTTETSLSEMRDFFEKNPDAGAGDRARRQAISQVKANIKWIELRQEELISYLQSVEITD